MGEGGWGSSRRKAWDSGSKSPSSPKQGDLEAQPLELGDFCFFFNKNNAFEAKISI